MLSVGEQQYELKSTCPGSAPTVLALGEGARFATSSVWKDHRFSDSQKKKKKRKYVLAEAGMYCMYVTKKIQSFSLLGAHNLEEETRNATFCEEKSSRGWRWGRPLIV